jgi:hypothetical protein
MGMKFRVEDRSERSMKKTQRSVVVHIEELVLDGFVPGDRDRIADALKQELARMMSGGGPPGILKTSLALERIDGGQLKINVGSRPQATGTQIAQAVYGSLTRQVGASSGSPVAKPEARERNR